MTGGPESTGLEYKEPFCRSNGTPLSALTLSQHPATALPAQRAAHVPTALWEEGYLPPYSTKSRMWAPWQGAYHVPTSWHWCHELALSQDGRSKPLGSCGTHQDCPHWHCSPTSDVSTPWGATTVYGGTVSSSDAPTCHPEDTSVTPQRVMARGQ